MDSDEYLSWRPDINIQEPQQDDDDEGDKLKKSSETKVKTHTTSEFHKVLFAYKVFSRFRLKKI